MDRARRTDAGRAGAGRRLAGLIAAGALALGCQGLTLDADRVIAIETRGVAFSVAVGDTVRLTARALNTHGAAVPGAVITWVVIDTGTVGFTLDGATGLVRGTTPGGGRVQARVENLRSDPLRITVTAPTPGAAIVTGTSES